MVNEWTVPTKTQRKITSHLKISREVLRSGKLLYTSKPRERFWEMENTSNERFLEVENHSSRRKLRERFWEVDNSSILQNLERYFEKWKTLKNGKSLLTSKPPREILKSYWKITLKFKTPKEILRRVKKSCQRHGHIDALAVITKSTVSKIISQSRQIETGRFLSAVCLITSKNSLAKVIWANSNLSLSLAQILNHLIIKKGFKSNFLAEHSRTSAQTSRPTASKPGRAVANDCIRASIRTRTKFVE